MPLNGWTEFVQQFGDIQTGNRHLAHAVYGFFDNGGTRCWVARVATAGDLAKGVDTILGAVREHDEIALVAAPLPPDTTGRRADRRAGRAGRALPPDGGPGRDPRLRRATSPATTW